MKVPLYLIALAVFVLWLVLAKGWRNALWVAWPVGVFLVYTNIIFPIGGGFRLTPHIVTALCLLCGVMLSGPVGPLRIRWCLTDVVVVLWLASLHASAITNHKYLKLTSLALFCWTIPPYLFGRWYLRSREDIPRALRPMAICLAILAVCIVLESLTGLGLVRVLGGRPRLSGMRLGLHRAIGSFTGHISMGMGLLTTLPLALAAAAEARRGTGRRWWRWLPWLIAAAVFGTVSRGPVAAVILAVGVYLFFRSPSWRIPLLLGGIALALVIALEGGSIKAMLHQIAGGERFLAGEYRTVVINDEEMIYTGMDHRWMLWLVYAEPLAEAGPFGYGFGSTARFLEQGRIRLYFSSLDNNYVAFILRYGYVGMTLFLLLALLPLYRLVKVALDRDNPYAALAAGLIGATLAFHAGLYGVVLFRECEMPCMFLAGLAVSVGQLGMQARSGVAMPAMEGASWYPGVAPSYAARAWPPPSAPGPAIWS